MGIVVEALVGFPLEATKGFSAPAIEDFLGWQCHGFAILVRKGSGDAVSGWLPATKF